MANHTLTLFVKHPLPDFLKGRITETIYSKWVNAPVTEAKSFASLEAFRKAADLLRLDKKRGKLYAANADQGLYAEKVHQAVLRSDERDPYP